MYILVVKTVDYQTKRRYIIFTVTDVRTSRDPAHLTSEPENVLEHLLVSVFREVKILSQKTATFA